MIDFHKSINMLESELAESEKKEFQICSWLKNNLL